MPDEPRAEHITKTEASFIYRRSERSLSRDITNAIKFKDAAVLQNVELRLEDGTRRPGTELTIREIVELRDSGFNPTWLLHTAWLQKSYGRRDEPPSIGDPAESRDAVVQPPPTFTTLPEDFAQRAAVLLAQNLALERLNADLKSQTVRLEKELDRRAEERREENELQKQNNVLMQQVYNLLSNMQGVPGPMSILSRPVATTRNHPMDETSNVNGHVAPERKGIAAVRKASTGKSPRNRSKPTKRADDQRQPSSAIRKYLPTLDRAVRSLFHK